MAWTRVNHAIYKGVGTGVTLSWTPVVNNLLVVNQNYNSNTAGTVPKDKQNNPYAIAEAVNDTSGGNYVNQYYAVLASVAANMLVSLTWPTTGDAQVIEYSGGVTSSILGNTNSATDVGGTGTQPTVTLAPAGTNSLFVINEFDEGTGGALPDSGVAAPLSLVDHDDDNSANERMVVGDYFPVAGGTSTLQTTGFGGAWGMVAAEYKAPAGGVSYVSMLSSLGAG